MSRYHGRGYHRRGSAVCQTSFSIDKLFKESSNKPSAARSAGTIGKWGITSFTTIRGSGFGSKYTSRNDRAAKPPPGDSAAFDADLKPKPEEPPKPKKFFKSRNAGATSESTTGTSGVKGAAKSDSAEKRPFTSKITQQNEDQYKPPIVLRIFKGTSCIIADDSNSPPRHSPRGDKSPGARGRRRSTQDPEAEWSPHGEKSGRRRSVLDNIEPVTPSSPRPKRARREVIKDPALQSIISQLISDEEESEESGFESQQATVPSTDLIDDNSEDSIPIARTEFYRQSSANKENEEKVVPPLIVPLPKPDEDEEEEEEEDAAPEEVACEKPLDLGTDLTKPKEVVPEPIIEDMNDSSLPDEHVADLSKPKVDEEDEDEDSDGQEQDQGCDSGVMMTSQVESNGLKLVIKKAPEQRIDPEPSDLGPVKTLPIKKKSIFKSRRNDEVGNTKRLALYKHNWNSQQAEAAKDAPKAKTSMEFTEEEHEFGATALLRVPAEPRPGSPAEDATKVKCDKKDKGFYTVIRNVKKAHQIQESGEFQEFNDDVDYILDALQDNNPVGTRCLSAITLAAKCMAPAFRMHVRAHGTVAKFFRALHDATKDQSLGLCTATVMFVLSQDRLNMDLDRDSLELMLNLLESDASHTSALDDCGMSSAQLKKNKQKVKELCAEIQGKGLAKHLNLENITVGQLAMETLLSLTSRRAGEWFKEELRELGGLDHIVRTISECSRSLETYISQWTDPLLERLRKIDRCLRVLENVTTQNEENQGYLLRYQNGLLLSTVISLYKVCNDEIALYPCTDAADKTSTGYVLREALLSTLKVLIQLTQDYSKKLFSQTLVDGRTRIMESSLHLLLQVPNYIPEEEKFEFIVLVLSLLINLTEHNEDNRMLLMYSKAPPDPESILETRDELPAAAALVQLFYAHEKRALEEEAQTDAILDGKKEEGAEEPAPGPAKSKGEEIEETIAKLLKKAGNHMEHTFIGAYISILIGHLIMDCKQREEVIRAYLPDGRFSQIIAVLEKFVNFMKMTAWAASSGSQHTKATERILSYYNQIEKQMAAVKVEEVKQEEPTDLSVSALYDDTVLDYTMP